MKDIMPFYYFYFYLIKEWYDDARALRAARQRAARDIDAIWRYYYYYYEQKDDKDIMMI